MRVSKKKNLFIILFLLSLAIFLAGYKFKSSAGNLRTVADDLLILINQPYLIKKDYSQINLTDIKEILKNIFISLKNINNHKNYEKIEIEVSFKNYLKLMNDRDEAIKTSKNHNFLSEKTKVKGYIIYKNKKIPVKIRLKGDRADHWLSKKRFSLNFEIIGNNSLFGFKNFSLTNHLSRQFPGNVIIAKSLGRNNILNYEFKTLKVKFNEQNWGFMLAQEEISPNFFESRKIKETPIARFTNEEDRRLLSLLVSPKIDQKEVYNHTKFQSIYEIDFKKKNKYLENVNNRNIISFFKSFHIDNLIYEKSNSRSLIDHFNIDKFAALIAYSITFKDLHNTFFTNIKFYFNPYTNKIEPIPNDYDIDYFNSKIKDDYLKEIETFLKKYSNKIYINLFDNNVFHEKLFYYLKLIKKDLQLIKKDLNDICYNFVSCESNTDIKLIKKNLNFIISNEEEVINLLKKISRIKDDDIFKQIKFRKFNILDENKKELEKNVLKYLRNYLYFRTFDDGEIQIKNLTLFNIKLKNLIFYNIDEKRVKCLKNNFNELEIDNNESINLTLALKETCQLSKNPLKTKLIFEIKNEVYEQTSFLENNKIKSIQNFNYKKSSKEKLVLKGNKIIKNPIILEKNQDLIIENNTTLQFDSDTYILVDGGNFICKGDKNRNIKLQSTDKKFWGGIYIRNSKKTLFENCIIQNTKEFRSYSKFFTSLTGGINIYNSNVNFKNVIIKNSDAEDALNLINSKVNLKNVKIINVKSDGIDFDFSSGSVNNLELDFIGGDGLDFSGSNFRIENLFVQNAKDKGVSVGEASKIFAKNINISNSEIGIAVKDNSFLNLRNGMFEKNNTDFSAFNKKAYYKKGGTINLNNVPINIEKINFDKTSTINY